MKTYGVRIKAEVTKTYIVEAESEEEAIDTAHEIFTTDCDDVEEQYEQETLSIEEL